MRLNSAERAETMVLGAVVAFALVGVALVGVVAPPFTRVATGAVDSAARAGVAPERAAALAEEVRAFVISLEPAPLPPMTDGRAGFDDRTVAHLDDVRRVIVAARGVTALMVGVLLIWLPVRFGLGPRSRRLAGAGLVLGGAIPLAAAALGLGAGALDFDALFAAFHGALFAPGTWLFASDDLIIQLFPLEFWVAGAAAWALLVAAGSVAAIAVGRRLMFTSGEHV